MPHLLTRALRPAPALSCSPAIKQLLSKISKKKDQLAKKKLQVRVMAAGSHGHLRRWWLNPANGDEVVMWWLWLSVAMVFRLGPWCWQGRGRLPSHSSCLVPSHTCAFPHNPPPSPSMQAQAKEDLKAVALGTSQVALGTSQVNHCPLPPHTSPSPTLCPFAAGASQGGPQDRRSGHLQDQLHGPAHHHCMVQAQRGAAGEGVQQEPAVKVPLGNGCGARF